MIQPSLEAVLSKDRIRALWADSDRVIVGDEGHRVQIFSRPELKPLYSFQATHIPERIRRKPPWLFVESFGVVTIVHEDGWKHVKTISHHNNPSSYGAFEVDDEGLVLLSPYGEADVFEPGPRWGLLGSFGVKKRAGNLGLLLHGGQIFSGHSDGKIRVFSRDGFKRQKPFVLPGQRRTVRGLCAKEERLYSGGLDGVLAEWDIATRRLLRSAHVGPIRWLSLWRELFVVETWWKSSGDRRLLFWDLASFTSLGEWCVSDWGAESMVWDGWAYIAVGATLYGFSLETLCPASGRTRMRGTGS